jgi:putative FmdB family regulatory protein
MPLYEYEREDGTRFELKQKITEDPLTTCPTTGQKVKRILFPVAAHFKGSGFYQNDYKTKKPKKKETKG